MIISRSADYGLRALIYLAQVGREQVVPLERIATVQRLPPALLSKILQTLVRSGFVRSHRGHGGGFVLAADPAALKVSEVVQAIDGPFTVFECLGDGGFCHLCKNCKLRDKLRELETAISSILGTVSILDCVPDGAPDGGADPGRHLPTATGG